MNDFISRQAAIAAIHELKMSVCGYDNDALDVSLIYEVLGEIPAADVQPVKRGHWVEKHRHRGGYRQVTGKEPMSLSNETHTIIINERYEIDDLYCSECGKLNESVFTNFCPNCGAKMKSEDK